jgi:hypothetical protein
MLLAGLPYTRVEHVAGAVLNAATDPDLEGTAGCAYTLPDDGPVVRKPHYIGEGSSAVFFARMDALMPARTS